MTKKFIEWRDKKRRLYYNLNILRMFFEYHNKLVIDIEHSIFKINNKTSENKKKILDLYPILSKKLSKKEILLIHKAMRGNKVDETKLELLSKKLDYTDIYEIFMNIPHIIYKQPYEFDESDNFEQEKKDLINELKKKYKK